MPSAKEILAAIDAAVAACVSVARNDLELMIPAALLAAEAVRQAALHEHLDQTAAAYRAHGVSDFGV